MMRRGRKERQTKVKSNLAPIPPAVVQCSERYAVRDEAVFVGLAFERFAEIWMGNGNERLGTLRYRFALETDHPVLGDDVHDIGARRRNDVSGSEAEHDTALGLAALIVCRGQADERLAAFRGIGAAHELKLSPRAANVAEAVGL